MQSAATDVAAFRISSYILHPLFRLSVGNLGKKGFELLKTPAQAALQATFRDVAYLIIHEISTVGVKQLHCIDQRHGQMFQDCKYKLLGGLNIILAGDCSPVGQSTLFKRVRMRFVVGFDGPWRTSAKTLLPGMIGSRLLVVYSLPFRAMWRPLRKQFGSAVRRRMCITTTTRVWFNPVSPRMSYMLTKPVLAPLSWRPTRPVTSLGSRCSLSAVGPC